MPDQPPVLTAETLAERLPQIEADLRSEVLSVTRWSVYEGDKSRGDNDPETADILIAACALLTRVKELDAALAQCQRRWVQEVERRSEFIDMKVAALLTRVRQLETALRPTVEGESFPNFLRWLADRLVDVYGASPQVDFVWLLRNRADALEYALAAATEPREGE